MLGIKYGKIKKSGGGDKTILKEYKAQAILGVWGGIFFSVFGYFILSMPQTVYLYFGRMMMVGGYILLICGSFMYAKGKGYNWYVGLLGVLGILGLLILYCLKDRSTFILKKRQKDTSSISSG